MVVPLGTTGVNGLKYSKFMWELSVQGRIFEKMDNAHRTQ